MMPTILVEIPQNVEFPTAVIAATLVRAMKRREQRVLDEVLTLIFTNEAF